MNPGGTPRWIEILQTLSMIMIWIFVLGISVWIIHMLRLARQWNDVPSASVGISIVAIPVFMMGAAVLTYVFVGLRRGAADHGGEPEDLPGKET